MSLNPSDRDKLVDALLKCDCMLQGQRRRSIVRDLPSEVQQSLNDALPTKDAVSEIVHISSKYPGAMDALLQRVRYFEGESSYAWKAVARVAAEILTLNSSAPNVPAPVPRGAITSTGEPEYFYDVFLSHNSQNKPAVEQLAKRLVDEAGITLFLDKWNLIPGNPWQEELETALRQSRTVAVFLGPQGISPWENEEMRAALARRATDKARRVIPVLLPGAVKDDSALPDFLQRLTWVDFHQGIDDADAFRRLVAGIRGEPPGRGRE